MTRLTLNSNPNNILELEDFLIKVAKDYNICKSKYPDILISITEAVNNAIIHGNKSDENKVVMIDCQGRRTGVTFKIKDEGTGFEPSDVPNPTLEENLECCGGRGVFIMNRLSDKLTYKKNGTEVEMYFKHA